MDIVSIISMLVPVIITVLGGAISSIAAGKFAPAMSGWKKQGLVILLCFLSGLGSMWLSGAFDGIKLSFADTESTFASGATLITLLGIAWSSAQTVYYKYTKEKIEEANNPTGG